VKPARRNFLIAAGSGGAALLVGWGLLPDAAAEGRLGDAHALPVARGELALNGWLKLGHDGRLTVLLARSEMGQGVHTALPMLVAEELGVPLAALAVEPVPLGGANDRIYGNIAMFEGGHPLHPRQIEEGGWLARSVTGSLGKLGRNLGLVVTGGSSSVADGWQVLRLAGAVARETLKAAAARTLGVAADSVSLTADACVSGGQRLAYAELARGGADLARFAPRGVALKPPEQWGLIGTPAPRLDVPAKVDGSARFGIDVRLPGMVYAAVRMAPALGGSIATIDDKAARALPGVLGVERLAALAGSTAGVAVVGRSYWHARQGLDALRLSWNEGPAAGFDSDAYLDALARQCREGGGFPFVAQGDAEAALRGAATTVEAEYRMPFLAHVPMEPINCTAQFRDGRLTLWASTQVPSMARYAAARAAGIDTGAVQVHVQLLGGGFGRRLEVDFIAQAAQLARQLAPTPVQMIWPREEDLTHDFYRPPQAAWLRAGLDAQGRIAAWLVRSAGPAITPQIAKRVWGIPDTGPDKTASEGLFDVPYAFANASVRHARSDCPVPVGFWRSVGHSMNAYISETFIDRCAAAARQDPAAFRLAHLQHAPRHAAVLQKALAESGYRAGAAPGPGRAWGVALAESFGSIVAQVLDVVAPPKPGSAPRVLRVTAAIDCGIAVNPGIVAQQMESNVAFGLSAALWGRIDIRAGRVQQTNFPSYPILGLADMPRVDTHVVPSRRAPGGVGEPGLPPVAPALANALARLSGEPPVTRLPLVA
jgi:isoquinoline 1-oxidoreductase beta subunit